MIHISYKLESFKCQMVLGAIWILKFFSHNAVLKELGSV